MLIRPATLVDIPAILHLYETVLDKNDVLTIEQAEIHFNKIMSYPNYNVYVAENEANVVGTFALLIMDNLAHQGKPSGIVEDVVVAETYQNQGIGKAMMAYALEVCKTYGCYKMVLSSNLVRTDAHAFYEHLGFEKHGFSYRINL